MENRPDNDKTLTNEEIAQHFEVFKERTERMMDDARLVYAECAYRRAGGQIPIRFDSWRDLEKSIAEHGGTARFSEQLEEVAQEHNDQAQRHSDDQGAFSDGEKHKKGNPLRQFAGRNSMTQNGEQYMEAYHMWREEKPMGEIFEKTGWFRGVDGKWRYEIQNHMSTINFGELLHLDYPGQVRRLHAIYQNLIQEFEKAEADWFLNDALDTGDEILAAADATLRKAEANLFYQGFRL